jgi:hypothetical protein
VSRSVVAVAVVFGVAVAAHLSCGLTSVFGQIVTTKYQLLAGVLS